MQRVDGGPLGGRARGPAGCWGAYSVCMQRRRLSFLKASVCLLLPLSNVCSYGSSLNVHEGGPAEASSLTAGGLSSLARGPQVSLQDETPFYYPSLSLEEGEECILTEGVPPNAAAVKKTVDLMAETWAAHRDSEVEVKGELRAEQSLPSFVAGAGKQFFLSFQLPTGIFEAGEAMLSLYNDAQSTGNCPSHILQIRRMEDDSFLTVRDDLKASAETVTVQLQSAPDVWTVDISSLFYGKVAKGEKLHLVFREQEMGCWSTVQNPVEANPPLLTVNVLDSTPENAVYEEWGPFSDCRVSCFSSVNYRCRKRSCLAGVGTGMQCRAEEMLERQPCQPTDTTASCTCSDLTQQSACPMNATCDATGTEGARCACAGGFSRPDLTQKTVCQLSTDPALELYGMNSTDSSDLSSSQTENEGSSKRKWYWIGGTIGVLVLIMIVALLLMNKPKPRASFEDVGAGVMQPGAAPSGYWAQGGMGGPPGAMPPMAMGSPYAIGPVRPDPRMQGPGRPGMM
ncbi:hypothetical protein Efla_002615 [Eimeria flavescens]